MNPKKNCSCNNNSFIPSIWGPYVWKTFHTITFSFPIDPSQEDKENYYNFFLFFGKVIPCSYCKESYLQFIIEDDTKLNIDIMEINKLTHWGFLIHNKVNKKLGIYYSIDYDNLCKKYNSYKINNNKESIIQSYKNSEHHESPIIEDKYCIALHKYAIKNGIPNFMDIFLYYKNLSHDTIEWIKRDKIIRKIINKMKRNGIMALNEKQLPTQLELILISMKSSTLNNKDLDKIVKKIKYEK